MRRAVEDLLAFLLRHAAEHAEDLALPGLALEVLQAVEDLLLGLVADAAGVVEHESGFFGRFHLRVALRQQRADDLFGVVGIHLAAKCFDVEGFPRHCIYRIVIRCRQRRGMTDSALRTGPVLNWKLRIRREGSSVKFFWIPRTWMS